jgi:hypothetical protein
VKPKPLVSIAASASCEFAPSPKTGSKEVQREDAPNAEDVEASQETDAALDRQIDEHRSSKDNCACCKNTPRHIVGSEKRRRLLWICEWDVQEDHLQHDIQSSRVETDTNDANDPVHGRPTRPSCT